MIFTKEGCAPVLLTRPPANGIGLLLAGGPFQWPVARSWFIFARD
jgi:hypothetical protein